MQQMYLFAFGCIVWPCKLLNKGVYNLRPQEKMWCDVLFCGNPYFKEPYLGADAAIKMVEENTTDVQQLDVSFNY